MRKLLLVVFLVSASKIFTRSYPDFSLPWLFVFSISISWELFFLMLVLEPW